MEKTAKSQIMGKLSVVLVASKSLCDTNALCFVCCRNIESAAECWYVHTVGTKQKIAMNFALNENVDTYYW